jgi:membrane protease YdiL (CAAX protease family)
MGLAFMADDNINQRPALETSWTVHVAALSFVMLLPTVATLLYFVLLSGSPWMQGVYFGSKVVQFGFPLLWVLAVQRRKLHLTRPDIASIKPGLLVGVLIVATGLCAYFGYLKSSPFLQAAPELIGLKTTDMGLTSPAMYIVFAVFLAIPHSLLEEYYWRWFVFGQLRRVAPFWVALLLSSLGFMAHHVIVIHQFLQQDWPVTLFFSLCVAFGGCCWAWLYERYRSLYGPWLSHLLVDCGIMYIGYDLIPWN